MIGCFIDWLTCHVSYKQRPCKPSISVIMNKKIIFLLLCTLICFTSWSQELTTFILVRHAEKANDGTRNPPLNELGYQRAANLATLLQKQQVSALYSTPFTRTEETLQPLADQQKLQIQTYDPQAGAAWLEELKARHQGGTVLISGHSNTIPGLANALLGEERFAQFSESEYSNLIVIVAQEVGNAQLIRLSF